MVRGFFIKNLPSRKSERKVFIFLFIVIITIFINSILVCVCDLPFIPFSLSPTELRKEKATKWFFSHKCLCVHHKKLLFVVFSACKKLIFLIHKMRKINVEKWRVISCGHIEQERLEFSRWLYYLSTSACDDSKLQCYDTNICCSVKSESEAWKNGCHHERHHVDEDIKWRI